MKNMEIITRIIYGLAICGFITYLITKNSMFMFIGGLLLIIASTMQIIFVNKKKK